MQNRTEERGMRREDGRLRMEGGGRRRKKDRGRRMEDSRQDLRTECRDGGAVVGFGRIWPCISGGRRMEDGRWRNEDGGRRSEDRGMKTLEGGHKNEERGTGRASGAFPIGT